MGQRRLLHPFRGTEQAKLLARKVGEQNPALKFSLHGREEARKFQHTRGARGIVIRAGMNLADLRRRKRIHIAITQMIVMRADDDVLVGFSREIREHIVHRGPRTLHIHLERNIQFLREIK